MGGCTVTNTDDFSCEQCGNVDDCKRNKEYKAFEEVGVEFIKTCTNLKGNKKLYFTLLKKFNDSWPERIVKISSHIEQNDFEAIKTALHSFKGVSLNLGMAKISEMIREYEKIWTEDHGTIQQELEDLHELLKSTSRVIEENCE